MRIALILALFAVCSLASNCSRTSVGFTPLIDMTPGQMYQGVDGMLYASSNTAPQPHMDAIMNIANSIGPLNSAGAPDAGGQVVWFSIGMSNTNGKSNSLLPMTEADPLKASNVHFVNGANGGIPVEDMTDPGASYWTTTIPGKLSSGGVTKEQVQIIWLLQTHRSPSGPFSTWYLTLRDDLSDVCRNAYAYFPNLKIVYFSPRSYAGYASGTLNPEPYAYESGYSIRKLIRDQIAGDMTLNWNPAAGIVKTGIFYWAPELYIWADGINPSSSGLSFVCGDYDSEGTHPSSQGYTKIAGYMLGFYQTDPTCVWYRGSGSPPTTSTSPPSPSTTSVPTPPGSTTSQAGGAQCSGYGGAGPCLADCECGGCMGSSSGPNGCVPVGDQTRCVNDGGTWHAPDNPCATSAPAPTTTTSAPPPPPTTSTSVPPPPTTTSVPPPPTTTTTLPPPTTTTSVAPPASTAAGEQCYDLGRGPCLADCECGGCQGSGAVEPVKGCAPAWREAECQATWYPGVSPC